MISCYLIVNDTDSIITVSLPFCLKYNSMPVFIT